MTSEWSTLETSRHQDHVIAHVLGTTVLGYFEFDRAAHLLLDIGFIWTIYLDGEMGLLTQSLSINEMDVGVEAKAELLADVDRLHEGGDTIRLRRMSPAPVECLVKEVSFHTNGERRRILIAGEEGNLAVVTSLDTGEIHIEQADAESPLA
ncbi:MAG: hypothetical protein QOJ02_257 [Acidobacteriota bacterium]|jgi:hypothetical protein|nr:hypothetical protein [Acidobacteriota bacterium]